MELDIGSKNFHC